MIVERYVSADGLLTLLVDLTADDWTIGLEGYAWHTHGDILSAWGYTGSPVEATQSFVADVLASRRPIVISRVNGIVRDVIVPAEYDAVESSQDLAKYGVPGETTEARFWDGLPVP